MDSLKAQLKKISVINWINSQIKDLSLSYETWLIKNAYKSKIEKVSKNLGKGYVVKMLQERFSQIERERKSKSTHLLHIYFVGTYYDHEAFGLLQAFQQIGKVTIFFDKDGKYGINSTARTDGSPAEQKDNLFLVDEILKLHAIHRIDFVIGTFLASTIALENLNSIQKMGIPVINIALDDRLPQNWYVRKGVRMGAIGLGNGVTLTLQSTKEFVPRYLAEGFPCIYWPLASDAKLFIPSKFKDIDVLFIGNNYGKRNDLINSIQKSGIKIECYGRGFPNGHIPGNKVVELSSRAKIILGTGLVGHSSSIVTLKLRDFDGPMSEALYITSFNPDLLELYELNKEIITYTTIKECIFLLKYYLENDEKRIAIARAGRLRACSDHTWDQRMKVLLELLNLQ